MKDLLILLPGNPSIPGIYDTFIAELRDLMPDTDALALTHYGQSALDTATRKTVNLERVIEQHHLEIKRILKRERPRRLYLVAHSLGSAVAVCLYPRLSSSLTEIKLVLVCPFLGPKGRNATLLKALSISAIHRSLQFLIKGILANESLSRSLMQKHLNLGNSQNHVYQALSDGHYLHNLVTLVSDYTSFFQGKNLHHQLDKLPLADTLFILAPHDFWVPKDTIARLPDEAQQLELPGIDHGFCLHPGQCALVARASSAFFKKDSRSGRRCHPD